MMLGVRTGAWTKSGYTAKDYVQDGLIAMWDGIENAGWGSHDSDITIWKDLIGGMGDATINRNLITFMTDHVYTSRVGRLIVPNYSVSNKDFTLEVCASFISRKNDAEFGVIWDDPWLGVNIRGTTNVRFTCQGDFDFTTDTTKINTYSLTRGTSGRTFYISGLTVRNDSTAKTSVATKSLRIGVWQENKRYPYHDTRGNCFCCRIYERKITAEEVAANYAIDKTRFGIVGES